MKRPVPLSAAALLALCLASCAGGESGEAGHTSAEPRQTAPNAMSGLPAGDAERGRRIAEVKSDTRQACAECHGPGGNKPIDPSYPRLAGQYADYLAHTLQMYRDTEREHPVMNMQSAKLTDQEIADVAAYFETQKGQLGDLSHLQ